MKQRDKTRVESALNKVRSDLASKKTGIYQKIENFLSLSRFKMTKMIAIDKGVKSKRKTSKNVVKTFEADTIILNTLNGLNVDADTLDVCRDDE